MSVDVLVKDVGSGYGSQSTVAFLRDGQLAKRLITLRTLIAELHEHHRPDAEISGLLSAFQSLTEIQRTAPEDVERLLLYPNTGSWLTHCMVRIRSPDQADTPLWPDLGYLGWLAAAGLIAAGGAGTMSVVVRNGAVLLPRLGLARLGKADEHGHCELRWDGLGALEFTYDSATLRIPSHQCDDHPEWLPLRQLHSGHGRPKDVFLDDIDPFRDLSDPYIAQHIGSPPPRLSAAEAGQWQDNFNQAWAILNRDFAQYVPPMVIGLSQVVPLTATPLVMGASSTSFQTFGCVNMSAPVGPQQLALTLIHEFQHAKLAALNDQVQLHEPDPTRRFYAPWRDDPRPLSGLLQGIYAHVGVSDFWRIHRDRSDRDSLQAHVEFARWRTQVEQAIAEVNRSGLLTPEGVTFIDALAGTLRPWLAEPVPAAADQLARESAIAHRVVWCVRNLRPDAAGLDGLYDRWISGRSAPSQLPDSALADQERIPKDFRSRLLPSYLKLFGPQDDGRSELSEYPASDLAYADGYFSRALSLYVRELDSGPTHPQPWAGVALSLPRVYPSTDFRILLNRAEVVAQLYNTIRSADRECNIFELVSWLSGGLRGGRFDE
jgi:HEXXH motif-containing protein